MPAPKDRQKNSPHQVDSRTEDDGTPATEAPEDMAPRPEPGSPAPRPAMPANDQPDEDAPELAIPVNTVAWIILKAREYDVKEPATIDTDDEDGHNALGVLEDRSDDATAEELVAWISDLDEEQAAELVALMWLGRADDEDAGGFPALVEEARGRQFRGRRTADYLLGTPQLGDYLEEGLEKLGVDTANLEGSLR